MYLYLFSILCRLRLWRKSRPFDKHAFGGHGTYSFVRRNVVHVLADQWPMLTLLPAELKHIVHLQWHSVCLSDRKSVKHIAYGTLFVGRRLQHRCRAIARAAAYIVMSSGPRYHM